MLTRGTGLRRGDLATRSRRVAILVPVLAAVLPLAACSGNPSPTPSPGENRPSAADTASPTPGSDPTSAPDPSTAVDPQDQSSPSGSASRPPDPEAPATLRPAERPGSDGDPSVALQQAGRSGARWSDGLRLRVLDTERGTTTGRGRGSLPGAPKTSFTLELDNASRRRIDVSRVVLTLVYGDSPRRLAQRVYDDSTTDFSGVLDPGAREKAVYAFVLPADRAGAALVVDLDGTHALATLDGAAR